MRTGDRVLYATKTMPELTGKVGKLAMHASYEGMWNADFGAKDFWGHPKEVLVAEQDLRALPSSSNGVVNRPARISKSSKRSKPHNGPMRVSGDGNMNQAFLTSFCTRLQNRDPSAVAALRNLAHRHFHGDPNATRVLRRVATCYRSPTALITSGEDIIDMGALPMLGNIVKTPLNFVLHGTGKVSGLLANLLESAGNVTGNVLKGTTKLVAKPLHLASGKLAKTPKFLAPHAAVPAH